MIEKLEYYSSSRDGYTWIRHPSLDDCLEKIDELIDKINELERVVNESKVKK